MRAHQERTCHAYALEGLTDKARFDGLTIHFDVGILRHPLRSRSPTYAPGRAPPALARSDRAAPEDFGPAGLSGPRVVWARARLRAVLRPPRPLARSPRSAASHRSAAWVERRIASRPRCGRPTNPSATNAAGWPPATGPIAASTPCRSKA